MYLNCLMLALNPEGMISKVLALVLGLCLLIGCIRGLWLRQEVYDGGSARWMTWTQLMGIIIALVFIAYGVDLIDFPDWWYEKTEWF